jgi:hypothetical protein
MRKYNAASLYQLLGANNFLLFFWEKGNGKIKKMGRCRVPSSGAMTIIQPSGEELVKWLA